MNKIFADIEHATLCMSSLSDEPFVHTEWMRKYIDMTPYKLTAFAVVCSVDDLELL